MAIVGSAEIVLTARLDRLERELRQAEREVTGFSGRASSSVAMLGTKLAGLAGAAVSIGAVTAGIYKLGSGAISAASQVESLQTRLRSLLGSERAAADEYARLAQIASTTPFELRNVVQAGVTLRAFGESNRAAASAVSDLAAFMGVDITEAASAYGRAFAAGAGAADILKERGVLALVETRSGIEDLTKLSLPEFRRVLFASMVDPTGPIAGAAERLSKTWEGSLSNITDATFNLGAALGDIVVRSDSVKGSLVGGKASIDGVTESVNKWRDANRAIIDQQLGEWIEGLTSLLGIAAEGFVTVGGAANSAANSVADFFATAIVDPRYSSIQQQAQRRLNARGITAADLAAARGDTQAPMSPLFEGSAASDFAPTIVGQFSPFAVPPPPAAKPPPPTAGSGNGKKSRARVRTPQEILGDSIGLQRDITDAAVSRLDTEIALMERRGALGSEIAKVERQRLETLRASLETQVALLRAQGDSAGELARAEADLANITAELAAPAAGVADEFERASTAAQSLGSTLQGDILGSVRQFVVGIAQGTQDLRNLPRALSQATAGNVTSRIFDATFGAGGLFGTGTGAGDFRAFGANLGKAFGADSFANLVPADFTGPLQPGQIRAGSFGAAANQAGGIATTALAGFSTGQQLGAMFGINSRESQIGGGVGALGGAGIGFAIAGPIGAAIGGSLGGTVGTFVGDLFKDRLSKNQKVRGALDEAFKRAFVFPTLALAKKPPEAFASATAPGFAAGLGTDFTALSLLIGLEGTSATERGPRNLGRRAGFLGLTEEQATQQNRAVARATGKSVAEGVNDITVAFLRFQQEGKGAEITQGEYNDTVRATVRLLQDDLPAGIDASVFALGALEQFGKNQVVNLEDLADTLDEVARSAQSFGSAIADGLAKAVESGDIMDVSRSLAQSFTSEFLRQATDDLLENGALAGDLQSAIALQRDAAAAIARGDFASAATLQARLGDTFRGAASTIMTSGAGLVQSVRGLEASLGVASASGVVRQSTLVVQNIVDGRVVSESQHNLERLQRGGGVIVPQRM